MLFTVHFRGGTGLVLCKMYQQLSGRVVGRHAWVEEGDVDLGYCQVFVQPALHSEYPEKEVGGYHTNAKGWLEMSFEGRLGYYGC